MTALRPDTAGHPQIGDLMSILATHVGFPALCSTPYPLLHHDFPATGIQCAVGQHIWSAHPCSLFYRTPIPLDHSSIWPKTSGFSSLSANEHRLLSDLARFNDCFCGPAPSINPAAILFPSLPRRRPLSTLPETPASVNSSVS